MAIVLTGRTRSFRMVGSTALEKVRIVITEVSIAQRILPSQGLTDVVDGVLIQPISAKYPGIGFIRWVSQSGVIQGVEQRIEFKGTDFFPPTTACFGFEVYVTNGTVFNAEIFNGGGSMNLQDYYTKSEINGLLASLPTSVDAYTRAQVDAKLAALPSPIDAYTKPEVLALVAAIPKGFNYDQVAQPSNPTNGQTWRERNSSNNLLTDWFYNQSLGKWQSIQVYETSANTPGVSSNVGFAFNGCAGNSSFAIRAFEMSETLYSGGVNNNTNYWTISIKPFGVGATISLYDTKPGNGGDYIFTRRIPLNVALLPGTAQAFDYGVIKTGNPGLLYTIHTIRFRYER